MSLDERWERYTINRHFPAGEYVFREGDPSDAMYVVKSGLVAITKEPPGADPLVFSYRGAGELIGEVSLIADSPRTASIVAAEDSVLLEISSTDFWHIMGTDKDFQHTVMTTLIGRLLSADESRIKAAAWEREILDRFAALSTEHERMAEVMQLRRETIDFIVHDLRNPIGLAQTALELIRMDADFDAESDTARFVTLALGGLQRMLNLVNALLDVERLGEGKDTLVLEEVSVAGLIRGIVEQQQPFAAATDVCLSAAPYALLPAAQIDRERIERVIFNLIDNALKFTPPGGEVTVSAGQQGDKLVIAVNDTGKGIPADQRARVFDRFVQTEEGRKASGFGLGLAFCRSAVTAHGGEIWAEEGEGGKGTRIVFTLPVKH